MDKCIFGIACIACVTLSSTAQAALHDRGGGLVYDDVLNVTWLQDANYAMTSGYDADGRMTWQDALDWAFNLSYYDSIRNATYTDWRLPATTDTGAPGTQCTNSGTDCGRNVSPASSEIAHLFFVSLGNLSDLTTTGASSGAREGGSNPGSTLDNLGSFINFRSNFYWSGTEYAPDTFFAWTFDTGYGIQNVNGKTNSFFALAVRPGDVAPVPEPETYALMLVGLGLVGLAARRRVQ
jgi:hypothetical protein